MCIVYTHQLWTVILTFGVYGKVDTEGRIFGLYQYTIVMVPPLACGLYHRVMPPHTCMQRLLIFCWLCLALHSTSFLWSVSNSTSSLWISSAVVAKCVSIQPFLKFLDFWSNEWKISRDDIKYITASLKIFTKTIMHMHVQWKRHAQKNWVPDWHV